MVYKASEETQRRKIAKRELILNTASIVFAEKGYYSSTVKDIVDAAGISVGSFYFYFKNKEELFSTLYSEIINKIIASVDNVVTNEEYTNVEKLCMSVYYTLLTVQNNRGLTKILIFETSGINYNFNSIRNYNNDKLLQMIEKELTYYNEKEIIQVTDTKVVALAYIGAVIGIIVNWVVHEENKNLIDSAIPLSIFILQGVKLEFSKELVTNYIHKLKEDDLVNV